MLSLDKVSVSIEGVRVLREVSCEIVERKTTVLIGRNGAGKTTTLRAIMGLLALDGGTIRLDASELNRLPAYTRARAGIGYAPEDRRLIPELSVEENIRLPALALKLDRAETARRLDEVYKGLFSVLVERMQHAPEQIPVELDRLWCARSFEVFRCVAQHVSRSASRC